MKDYRLKTMLLLALFTMMFGFSAEAQISETQSTDGKIYQVEQTDAPLIDKDRKSVKKGKKRRHMARKKAHIKANKSKLKAMRKVAKADGVVTPEEKATIKQERRKMKKKGMKRKRKAGCLDLGSEQSFFLSPNHRKKRSCKWHHWWCSKYPNILKE